MARKPKTNVTINGYDYAKTSLTIGKDENGMPLKKIFYGKNKGEATQKKDDYKDKLKNGINPDLSEQSLVHAIYTWLWEIERYNGNKSSTFERDEGVYRNYVQNESFAMNPVSEIKKLIIQKHYNKLLDEGKSISQIKSLHKFLNKFFEYAESEMYIIRNPLRGLKLPKPPEDEIEDDDMEKVEVFSKEEIEKLKTAAGHKKIRYIMMFALLTGLREGEILALDKENDIIEDKIKVNKTLRTVKIYDDKNTHHYELKLTKPKTKNSTRDSYINSTLKKELKELNKLLMEERLKLGPAYMENNLLFPSLKGKYINAKNLRRSWTRLLKKAGVPYKKFHSLRHTFATTLLKNGVNIVTVSRLLGHSSIKTTEIYIHVLGDTKADALSVLDIAFN